MTGNFLPMNANSTPRGLAARTLRHKSWKYQEMAWLGF
jgi:hypothetical protein